MRDVKVLLFKMWLYRNYPNYEIIRGVLRILQIILTVVAIVWMIRDFGAYKTYAMIYLAVALIELYNRISVSFLINQFNDRA